MNKPDPLLRVLRNPGEIRSLSTQEWEVLIPMARRNRLLAHLKILIDEQGLERECPVRAWENMKGAEAYTRFLQRQISRELREVEKALKDTGIPILLLKGAAYLRAGLPNAQGRSLSDLDIMVPKAQIGKVEERLSRGGWASKTTDDYDQHYYREWMHEIPPMVHRRRSVEVDIHHNLLPLSGRFQIDADELWKNAQQVDSSGMLTLSPVDMILHSAAHLFISDELRGGLRDLVDISELCGHFSLNDDNFFQSLFDRSCQLNLSRPLYYALYNARELLQTPLPDGFLNREQFDLPGRSTTAAMKLLTRRVLTPHGPESHGAAISKWMLYIRSHWIRMPPRLLLPHLAHKAFVTPFQQWKEDRERVRQEGMTPRQ